MNGMALIIEKDSGFDVYTFGDELHCMACCMQGIVSIAHEMTMTQDDVLRIFKMRYPYFERNVQNQVGH